MQKVKHFISNFLNDCEREQKLRNRNWFFIGTILFIVGMTILYFVIGDTFLLRESIWSALSETQFVPVVFLVDWIGSFSHADSMHLLGNMISFSILGMYVERKFGTIRFIASLFVISLLWATINSTALSWIGYYIILNGEMGPSIYTGGIGFSGVNFALKFFIGLDFLFIKLPRVIFKQYVPIRNIIWGTVAVVWIIITMSFQRYGGQFEPGLYPFTNSGHMIGMLTGAIVFLLFVIFRTEKSSRRNLSVEKALRDIENYRNKNVPKG